MSYCRVFLCRPKAIDVRKDSCVLYTNRALTKINLGLMDEVLVDCDRALGINERSLIAVLYKAEALVWLGDASAAQRLLADALEAHPDRTERIRGTTNRTIAECNLTKLILNLILPSLMESGLHSVRFGRIRGGFCG